MHHLNFVHGDTEGLNGCFAYFLANRVLAGMSGYIALLVRKASRFDRVFKASEPGYAHLPTIGMKMNDVVHQGLLSKKFICLNPTNISPKRKQLFFYSSERIILI